MGCGVSQEASVKSLHSNIRWFDPEAPDAENRLDNIKAMKRFFNVRDPQNGNAAIHIAAQNGKAELVTYIINEGGLVDARNGTGQTAMHMATEYNMANVVRILKENKRGASYRIIISFLILCVSVLLVTHGDLESLAGVYTFSFLAVMCLFGIGNLLLKVKRKMNIFRWR